MHILYNSALGLLIYYFLIIYFTYGQDLIAIPQLLCYLLISTYGKNKFHTLYITIEFAID